MSLFSSHHSLHDLYRMCKFFGIKDREIFPLCGYTQAYFSRMVRDQVPVSRKAIPALRKGMSSLVRDRASAAYEKTVAELKEIEECLNVLDDEEKAFNSTISEMNRKK